MSQRTLWEEGRRPGRQVAALASAAALVVVLANLLLRREITVGFDIAFVVICVCAALAVRPRDFFVVGVLPPLLMFGAVLALALLARAAIAESGDGLIQAIVSGLAHHARALVAGYALTLVILALRRMASQRLPAQRAQQRRVPAPERAHDGVPQQQRASRQQPA